MDGDQADRDVKSSVVQDDNMLESKLASQKRPERPADLAGAREMMESLISRALAHDMTPPEARVEAVRVLTWFEAVRRAAPPLPTFKEPHGLVYGVRVAGMDAMDFADSVPGCNEVSTLLESGRDDAGLLLVVDRSEHEISAEGAELVRDWPSNETHQPHWDDLLIKSARSLNVDLVSKPGWIFLPN